MVSNVFEIDTKGTCLLCLSDSHSAIGPTTSSAAFKMLLRYLKIDLMKLSHFSTTFLRDLSGPDSIDISVSLCGQCASTTTHFLQLFQDMERIRMELDNCSGRVHEAIKEGEKDKDRVRKYRERISIRNNNFVPGDALNASIAEHVRKEIMAKCAARLTYSVPRVVLLGDEDDTLPAKASNRRDKIGAIQGSCLSSTGAVPTASGVHPRDTVEALETAFKETLEKYTLKLRSILVKGEDEPMTTVENSKTTPASVSEKMVKNGSSLSTNISLIPKRKRSYLEVENESVVDATDATSFLREGLIDVKTIGIRNVEPTTDNYLEDISLAVTRHDPLEISDDIEDEYESVASSSMEDTTALEHDPLEMINNDDEHEVDFQLQLNDPLEEGGFSYRILQPTRSQLLLSGSNSNTLNTSAKPDIINRHRIKLSNGKSQCGKCGKVLSNNTNFRTHFKGMHLTRRTISCSYCTQKFLRKDALQNHVVASHPLQEFSDLLPPNTTEQELMTAVQSLNYQKRNQANPTCPYDSLECPLCEKKLQNPFLLRVHIFRLHLHQLISALKMARGFEVEVEVPLNKVVMPIRVPISNKKYKCHKCEKGFNSFAGLWYHKRDVHLGVKLQCNHCGKTFTGSSSAKTRLKIHVAMEHTFQLFKDRFPLGTTEEEFTRVVEMMLPQVSMSSVTGQRTGGVVRRYKCNLCENLLLINEPRKSHICQKHLDYIISNLQSMKGKIEKFC